MARKNSNARRRDKPRRTRIKIKKPKVVILPVCKAQDDGISLGELRAVAEWRKTNENTTFCWHHKRV